MKNVQKLTGCTRALFGAMVLTASAVSGIAHAADDPMTTATGGNIASGDRKFVTMAAISDMTEIEASKLAQTKASSPAVKEFGTQMIADHTKTSGELMTISSAKTVTPPGTLDKAHRKAVDKLATLSGADFDKAYVKQMVSDHKDAVSLFEKESKSGKDGDLQAFAGKTLPSLQGHLKMAQDLSKMK